MGQAKKRRHCPAVSRDISSAECGENRLSHYACPESCPHNPFSPANYDAMLAIEDRLDAASMTALAADHPRPNELGRTLTKAATSNPIHGQHAAMVWQLFFARDNAGRTFAERWAAKGPRELKNDERVLLQWKQQFRVMLLEVHRIIDEQRFEAVDLLDPQSPPLHFIDRSMVATTGRFSTLLTWTYPTPHFWRTSGTAINIAEVAPFPALEIIDEIVRHLGGPSDLPGRRRWLAENFARIDDVVMATGMERRRQMFSALDGMFGSATYDLRAPLAECRAVLAQASVEDAGKLTAEESAGGFTSGLVWVDAGPQLATTLPGKRILGRILLGPKAIRVEAIGGARLDELRQRLENLLGPRIQFSKERRDDLAKRLLSAEPTPHLDLVPPRLLEQPTNLQIGSSALPPSVAQAASAGADSADVESALYREHTQRLLDERIPALGDRTPREAARDAAARPELLEWAKGIVRTHDLRNLKAGRTDDINALLRELGLTEIDFPAPPLRPVPEDESDEFEDDEYDDDDFEPDDDLDYDEDEPVTEDEHDESEGRATEWSALPLPDRKLTRAEAAQRLQTALDAFNSAGAAIAEMTAARPTILDEVESLCGSTMNDAEIGLTVVLVVSVWFALVPRGTNPLLRPEFMADEVDRQLRSLARNRRQPAQQIQQLLNDSPQPNLLQLVADQLAAAAQSGPHRMTPEATIQAIVVIKVLIAELDRALRSSKNA